ncbi:MAG: energy-coupling factor transporter transmembrane protein EcfT [Deltaproteobacteria bacterium]|nr:energy-coupling factor transporter transmembrane protein EcfT [Deltaproteobacteria bacterium]
MEKSAPSERKKGRPKGGYAFQYCANDSPVHRLGAGWKLALCGALGALAVAARVPWALGALLAVNLVYYFAAGLGLRDFWRDIRIFLIQTAIIVILYVVKYGPAEGLWPGIRTGVQILLLFLPGVVFVRTTQGSQMMRSLKRILPEWLSFVLFTSFRFLPFFAREFREIAMAQRLRGAPIAPRQVWKPKHWKDLFNCLMIPLMVRALKTAKEAALSAEARGFGERR